MPRMTLLRLPLLVLALLLGAAAAGREAQAQPFGPIDFPNLNLTYIDAQGGGSATLTNLGEDPIGVGVGVAVTITQNGIVYEGRGFAQQTGAVQFVASFWLVDGRGNAFFFAGTFVRGFNQWSGGGRYEVVGAPGSGSQWTMNTPPCPAC